jgi:hypothetical protein
MWGLPDFVVRASSVHCGGAWTSYVEHARRAVTL